METRWNQKLQSRPLFGLFVVSGFCGLIYESIWAKYLRIFLGAAAYAQAVVLVIFIGGLALGAWLVGRRAERIRYPLAVYAVVELAVGLLALSFHPLFLAATAWGYGWLLPATCGASGLCVTAFALAALLILPQSILLGSTFPLMVAGVLRQEGSEPGRKIALLYFLNSIGAVAGALCGTFALLPWLGLPGTVMSAGVLNVAIAGLVFALRRPGGPLVESGIAWKDKRALAGKPAAEEKPPTSAWPLWVAALTGFSSFIYEVVWVRMLSLVLGSSVHAFELMLASFILGIALGGLWISRRIDSLPDPVRFLAQVQIAMGVLALFSLAYYNLGFDAMAWAMNTLPHSDRGYVLFNGGSALLAMGMMLPATIAAGMTLPLLTWQVIRGRRGERAIGIVYAANTLGSIAGVLAAIYVALGVLGVRIGLIAGASIDILIGVWIFYWPARALWAASPQMPASPRQPSSPVQPASRRWTALIWSAGGIVAIGIATAFFDVDPLKAAAGVYRQGLFLEAGSTIAFHRDGKAATVDVVRDPEGVLSIRTNGKPDASIKMKPGPPPTLDEYMGTLLGTLPVVYRPGLKRAAVIGFGSGMTTSTLLDAPGVTRVDTIEIESAMVAGARSFLPRVERAYTDPRSNIVYDDARAYLARSGEMYDAVVSEPSNPWVSGVASLFTAEFYASVRHQLKPDGVFVQWLQCYEFDLPLLADIMAALDSAFADYAIYATSGELIVVASPGKALGEPSPDAIETGPLAMDLRRLGMIHPSDLFALWAGSRLTADSYLKGATVTVNSDYFPVVELDAPRLRYIGSRVFDFEDLALAPVPLMRMLDSGAPKLTEPVAPPHSGAMNILIAYRRAELSIDFLNSLSPDDWRPIPKFLPPEMRALRVALIDCTTPAQTGALWDAVVSAVGQLNPFLPPERLAPLWERIGRSQCLAALPPDYRGWITLFADVGARDPAAMARDAETLLARPLTLAQFQYVFMAEVAGLLAQGKHAEALARFAKVGPTAPDTMKQMPWFRLAHRLASELN